MKRLSKIRWMASTAAFVCALTAYAVDEPLFEDGFELPGRFDSSAVDDDATVDQGQLVQIDVLSNDIHQNSDTLTVTDVVQPAHGQVINNGASVTYEHDGSEATSDRFSYTVRGQNTGVDTAQVNVMITLAPESQANILVIIGDDMGIDTVTPLYPNLLENIHAIYDDNRGV